MNWKEFFEHNWKKILIVVIVLVIWYFVGSLEIIHIPGIGFKSGGSILLGSNRGSGILAVANKKCTCLGIPNDAISFGGNIYFYCIGIVINCQCFIVDLYHWDIYNKTKVDCNCQEGQDTCELFKNL